jgi:hypothetical protein
MHPFGSRADREAGRDVVAPEKWELASCQCSCTRSMPGEGVKGNVHLQDAELVPGPRTRWPAMTRCRKRVARADTEPGTNRCRVSPLLSKGEEVSLSLFAFLLCTLPVLAQECEPEFTASVDQAQVDPGPTIGQNIGPEYHGTPLTRSGVIGS